MGKKSKATSQGKKSRAKYQCSLRLVEIIERVNRLTPGINPRERELKIGYSENSPYYQAAVNQIKDFASFVENHKLILQKAFDSYYQQFGYDAVRDIDYIVENLGECLLSGELDLVVTEEERAIYILDWFEAYVAPNGIKALDKFKTAWMTVEEDRENLLQIIESYASTKKRKQKIDLSLVKVQSKIVIQDNKINVVVPEFFEVINGLDADRLRICKICNRIFWASRKDSETCSPQCANNLRVQRYREPSQTKLNKLLKELASEKNKLEKLELNLNQKNTLITQQRDRVNKLTAKIKEEKK